ncbi:MAG: serine protease [Lachnospiraceae bacterium]|nr:serine protease [Lachnospiraceae bacterium]
MSIFKKSTDNKNKKSLFDLSDGKYGAADSYGFINEEQTPQNRSIKRRKILTMILTVAFGAVLFGVISSAVFKFTSDLLNGDDKTPVTVGTSDMTPRPTQGEDPVIDPSAFKALESLYDGVRATASSLRPCIAEIAAVNYVTDPVFGSKTADSRVFLGVVFGDNRAEYLILTRNDSLDGSYEDLQVTFNRGGTGAARIVRRSEEINLAVLAVSYKDMSDYDRQGISPVSIGDSADCDLGTALVAVGFVNGRSRSANVGFITSEKETVYIRDNSLELMETNMPLYDNAFGVTLSADGKVVGIITEAFGESSCLRAITINSIRNMLYDMLNDNKTVQFGAMLADINSAARKKLGIKGGIQITEVFDGTPADAAGFRKGDILLKLGDDDLYFVSTFNALLRKCEAGDTVTIEYRRGEQVFKTELTIRME